jgi:Family of unknown function (DUF5947)
VERAPLVSGLRRLARPPAAARPAATVERCELCGAALADEHRHLLDLEQRVIVCACETCVAVRGGDGPYRPAGQRVVWLPGLELPDDLWARFAIPIGLAFFLRSSVDGRATALYPSPGGATECELDLCAFDELVALNPALRDLEPDAEALVVDRLAEPRHYAIAPIDECYRLVGLVRTAWSGISGGDEVRRAVGMFFAELQRRAVTR